MIWWGVAYMIGAGLFLGVSIWLVSQMDRKRLNAPIAVVAAALWPVMLIAAVAIGLLDRLSGKGRQ